jgi:hypothetical protein
VSRPVLCIRCHREKRPGEKGWALVGEEGEERCPGCSTRAECLEALKARSEALSWEIQALRTFSRRRENYGGPDRAD